jgi:aminopeptidase
MIQDPRLNKIAKLLLNHSLEFKDNESLLIRFHISAKPLVLEIMKEAKLFNANITYEILDDDINFASYEYSSKLGVIAQTESLKTLYSYADCVISIYSPTNKFAGSIVESKKRVDCVKQRREAINIVNKKRWVLLNYPNTTMAENAKMSDSQFFDYYCSVNNVDYKQMYENMLPLKALMEKTDKVRIVSPNTDISFSIKGMPVIPCAGKNNVPDGEVFSAPIKDSVNGYITYNTPSPYQGIEFSGIRLEFKDGKIIKSTAKSNNEDLENIFNTDAGARYVGEFAIGVNPAVTSPMGNILYDEKIFGSIHFTPGNSYDDCNNSNKSSIHWDLVLIQTEEYGGGSIYFDDVLIRENGLFVVSELLKLNKR